MVARLKESSRKSLRVIGSLKLEQSKLVTSKMEFRDGAPDRKHYTLTEKGEELIAATSL